jgi:hypothetical protein
MLLFSHYHCLSYGTINRIPNYFRNVIKGRNDLIVTQSHDQDETVSPFYK